MDKDAMLKGCLARLLIFPAVLSTVALLLSGCYFRSSNNELYEATHPPAVRLSDQNDWSALEGKFISVRDFMLSEAEMYCWVETTGRSRGVLKLLDQLSSERVLDLSKPMATRTVCQRVYASSGRDNSDVALFVEFNAYDQKTLDDVRNSLILSGQLVIEYQRADQEWKETFDLPPGTARFATITPGTTAKYEKNVTKAQQQLVVFGGGTLVFWGLVVLLSIRLNRAVVMTFFVLLAPTGYLLIKYWSKLW